LSNKIGIVGGGKWTTAPSIARNIVKIVDNE